ncbi:hypothetical protein Ancab_004296 [Ancistrocladus abbreviatus]
MAPKVLLVAALFTVMVAMAASSPSLHDAHWGLTTHLSPGGSTCEGGVGDCIDPEEEMNMDTETSRRQLAGRGFISYSALKKNSIPCSRRGMSYYNCRQNIPVNPYRRACTAITLCKRYTG